jgi:archaellum component FlaC
MARPANPLTPVYKQLKVIQARYKKLGTFIEKLTNDVNASMKKGKAKVDGEVDSVKKQAKKRTGSTIAKAANQVKEAKKEVSGAGNKKKSIKKITTTKKK